MQQGDVAKPLLGIPSPDTALNDCPGGGGGGGHLGIYGGCIRSLSKLKNTPKALISGQKSTLILMKR